MAGDKDQEFNINIGGDVGGEVNVAGGDIKKVSGVQGDYVEGDKITTGDEVHGDKITVGDISGSTGVAIGSGASVSITSGNAEFVAALNAAVDEVIAKLQALPEQSAPAAIPDLPDTEPLEMAETAPPEMVEAAPPEAVVITPEDVEDAIAVVEEVRTEAEKGDEADEKFLERQFRNILRMGPDIFDVVTATLANPIAGITTVLQKVAAKAREEQGLEPV